ncbi:MAG TPA: squalene--hopene cyclase [Terriglobia bacterium]|nr:squalene--hopene cyclase [Terriglobia bacterium]
MRQPTPPGSEVGKRSQKFALAEVRLEEGLPQAIQRAMDYLLSLQAPEGYWVGELEADTTLESDYIFFLYVLGKLDDLRGRKLANYIRRRQLPDGGWNVYAGGPSELNATVKAYVALKLAGDSPTASHMARARCQIHDLGGVEATNSYTRLYLALGGALPWSYVPAIPPELILLPSWFFLNVYSMSSWTRAIVVPLTLIYPAKPRWPFPPNIGVEELFRDPVGRVPAFTWDRRVLSWRNFFLLLDRLFKLHERLPWKPLRKLALRRAKQWLFEHLERTEGLGAIYPAMVNSVLALRALGHSANDPLTAREMGHLARFEIEEGDTLRLQPCVSPIWDTALAMVSLQEAGLPPDHPALVKAAGWLLDRQVLGGGDWQVRNPGVEPGGWAFEFRNDFYPDVDDTGFVLMALQRVAYPDPDRLEEALRRGTAWILSMQNRDGGWGAFDRDNDSRFLTRVPFADHNAMIDPSTGDLTARVLEYLGRLKWPASDPRIQRGLAFLRKDQDHEGPWYGRWGVNYIYGTSGVLRAMETLGLQEEPECRHAAAWLRAVQNNDGGFGESCASYDDPELKGCGPSTASQTAWGLIGLLAAGEPSEQAVRRAATYLLEQQREDGAWSETACTGTGFPRVFYLRYHLYRDVFPLYALARFRNKLDGVPEGDVVRLPSQEFPPMNGHRRSR